MSLCPWCGRDDTLLWHARCAAERRRSRRVVSVLPPQDQEGALRFTASFFDDLRRLMAEGNANARAFVAGARFTGWCHLLQVPDEGAVRSHLLGRWVERAKLPRRERAWKPCIHCGESDPAKFRKRKDGYRSVCRECEIMADRKRRAMKRSLQ